MNSIAFCTGLASCYVQDITSSGPTPTPTATPIIQTPQPPIAGWVATNYTYTQSHPHAVTALWNQISIQGGTASYNVASYTYDANGNMTCRVKNNVTYKQTFNAENRLSSVQKVATGSCALPTTFAAKWDFAYDGDGTRVSQLYTPYDSNGNPQTPVLTVYFMAGAYEVTGSAVRKYYAIAGMTVAMRDSADGNALKYLLTDHLGSVVGITDGSGTLISQQRYLPFGQVRTNVGSISQTDFGYTGQRALSMGLMDYHARFYDSLLMRFISADTIIPSAANPQAFNRYSYVSNNPINYIDPTGNSRNDVKKWFYQAYGSNWRKYWNAWDKRRIAPPTCAQLGCDTSTSSNTTSTNTTTVGGDGSSGGGGDPANLLSSVWNSYLQGWTNFGSAWSTITNPDAPALFKIYSGVYIFGWGGFHLGLGVGLAGLACVAVGPGCVGVVEGVLGIGGTANAACGGDACASEVQDAAPNIDTLIQGAKDLYPKLADKADQLHHIFPKYLGGDPNGPTVILNPAYHQLITNEFRALWAYGQGAPALQDALNFMQQVYSKFPLP